MALVIRCRHVLFRPLSLHPTLCIRAKSTLNIPDSPVISPTTSVAAQPAFSTPRALTPQRALRIFLGLSKARLGALVVATTVGGFVMAPGSIALPYMGTLVATVVGTSLSVSSANTFNQAIEMRQDRLMARTLTRPIAAGLVSQPQAVGIAVAAGAAGVGCLYFLVNPLTAYLSLANIVLYAGVYTPLKQIHPINTWVGAIVGAIPPVMGWTAVTGAIGLPALTLALALYLWQMPHFFALSWLIKEDYRNAGFRMLVCEDEPRTAHLTYVYTLAMLSLGPCAALSGLTEPLFAIDATALTAVFAWYSWQFSRNPSKATARQTFFLSLLYLPLLMGLMFIYKPPQDSKEGDQ